MTISTIEVAKMRCAELAQALEAKNPGYKNILRDLHDNIRTTPELLFGLDDAEIATIIGGLSTWTGIEIAEKKAKEPISKKSAAKLSADDV